MIFTVEDTDGHGWLSGEYGALDSCAEERFQLRCEHYAVRRDGVEQRLLAHRVASKDECLFAMIEYGEGEHSPELAQHRDALLLIEAQEDFGIAVRAKRP